MRLEYPLRGSRRDDPGRRHAADRAVLAYHGLAMNRSGTRLCAAGTTSDYAAIVDRTSFAYRIAAHGRKPYWATNSKRST
jgi:hypothetical protein